MVGKFHVLILNVLKGLQASIYCTLNESLIQINVNINFHFAKKL